MFKKVSRLILLMLFCVSGFANQGPVIFSQSQDYYRIVILSDLHIPGASDPAREKMLETINSWPDVDLVAGLGDFCQETGSLTEYQSVKEFLGKLNKPFSPVAGNHDYIYEDEKKDGKLKKATPEVRKTKLERFKKTFGLTELYYSKKVGPYLLLFLSTDDLNNSYLTAISEEQIQWLKTQLTMNHKLPTIIFFHSPLEGTLTGNNEVVRGYNFLDFIAQPREQIKSILVGNPQVFLWVSGHVHIAPTNATFNHPVNQYQQQVYNLHNPDLKGSGYLSELDWYSKKHDTLWANSLYLYPDHVQIRTYDFTGNRWLPEHDRVIRPNLSKSTKQ